MSRPEVSAPPARAAGGGRRYALPWAVPARGPGIVHILPGQMSFGPAPATMRTLLGSCVAVTLWHPQRRLGGLCHYLLPQRPRRAGDPLDGRYGDEAVYGMVQLLREAGCSPADCQAHLYGGADTLPEGGMARFNVGERNIEQGWKLLDEYGFQLQGIDVGEDIPRTVTLDVGTGEVTMRRGTGRAPVNQLAAAG